MSSVPGPTTLPRFSVVVPAYNVSQHIGDTLRSLSEQSWPFHEVIVVDDGSTDGTADAIAASTDTYPIENLTVIRQRNAGVGVARNVGLSACRGEYVIFLDGDDVFDSELSRTLRDLCADEGSRPEIIYWKFHDQKFERLHGGALHDRWTSEIPERSTGPETLRRMFVSKSQLVNLLAAAYRRDFLLKNNLSFTPRCRSGEDSEFHCVTLAHASDVAFLDRALSTYVWRESSVTNSVSLSLFDGVLAYDRGAVYLARMLDPRHHDVVLAARQRVVPRFMGVFVDYCRAFPQGGMSLLAVLNRTHPLIVPRVRELVRDAEAEAPVDRKWTLFRLSPRCAAWYFGSAWSQSDTRGLHGRTLQAVRRALGRGAAS